MRADKLSIFVLPLTLLLPVAACGGNITEAPGDSETETGDGDPTGDGDGDPTGDGDGDPTGDGDGDPTGDGDGDPREAMLRFVAGGVSALPVDIYLDEDMTPAASGLAFEDGTDYVSVAAGAHVAKVVEAGDPPDDPLLAFPIDMSAGAKHSLAIHDYVLAALEVLDDDAMIAAGMVRMQLSHIAPDVGPIDVYALTEPPTLLYEDLDHGATQSLDVPPGPGVVGVDLDDDMVPELAFLIPDYGTEVLLDVYVLNEDGGDPVFLLAHLPDGSTERLDSEVCGDDVKGAVEACDGADLDGQTCGSLGFDSGTLSCLVDCSDFDTSACLTTTTYCDNNVVAIPDDDVMGVTVEINVPDMMTVVDVNLSADITHGYLWDLEATLSLDGTTVALFNSILDADDGLQCAGENMTVELDDEAVDGIHDGACYGLQTPAVDGTFTPEGTLSDFDGLDAQGSWTFFVADTASPDGGSVNEVCVTITGQ